MPTPQDILNKLLFHFDNIKDLMDKYPDAIHIFKDKEYVYRLEVNIDLLEIPPDGDSLIEK
ncbi:hypothetical protein [Flavobacterium frigoris]|uniref:Uncharacterized protein n=1 Tax=Flavobacterium frigoris TaxID=229204 RepID=A0A1H9S883_FLAFI|nr:hypothetical protein [Flavobacterium frigoris]SER81128.1 hypothetical protein SAMN05444355_1512 [Flavobacterium frigoris]